jgi:elongation factor P
VTLSINEIKSGLTILLDGQIYTVVEYQHVKPGKGAAFVRVKLRNAKDGRVIERTFKSSERIEQAFVNERKLQYLYRSDKIFHFMDQENFEQVDIRQDVLGENYKFLKDNLQISAYSYQGEVINVGLPTFIEFKVIHTEPGVRGDTARAVTKPVTIETGATLSTPLFVGQGDIIKVDTRSGKYVERVGK